MEEELEALSQLSPHDWEEPFRVASSWARRNLGRRLKGDTLQQAQTLIIAKQGDLDVRESKGAAPQQSPPPPPPPSNTTTQALHTRTHTAQIHAQQQNRMVGTEWRDPSQHQSPPDPISAKTHTPAAIPKTVHLVSACTMTEITGGWSLYRQEDLCDAASQLSPASPLLLPPVKAHPLPFFISSPTEAPTLLSNYSCHHTPPAQPMLCNGE